MKSSFRRSGVFSGLGVVVAMLLSLALAVPASAADAGKPLPTDPRFKYGMDYFYKEIFDPANPQGWKKLDVNGTVNPSKTGGTYSLNNQQVARTPSTLNKPLTGKVFVPGQPLPNGAPGGTVVKPPSVYKPTAPFTGSMGLGRLLGTAGAGMGGVTQAPSNVNEIAASQGVAAGCLQNRASCSSTDMGKLFSISNCGHTSSCKTIGAKDDAGNPITSDVDWWKDTAVPFLADLWARITGQTDDEPVPMDVHISVNSRGCDKMAFFKFGENNTGVLSVAVTADKGRPPSSQTVSRAYYDADCYGSAATALAVSPSTYQTICLDKATGLPATNPVYSASGSISGTYWNADGTTKQSLCGPGTASTHTLMAIRFWNTWTQAQFDGSPSSWDALEFSEYINPNPDLDYIDGSTVTTTVDCAAPNGQTFTYSESVKQVGAFSAPACPLGFDLARHDIKTGTPRTLDSGKVDPGAAAKYPLCSTATGPGCSLWVKLDGVACTVGNVGCHTWADTATRQPSRVGCMWGTYTMPISDCYTIAEGYKTESGLVLDPKSGAWVAVDSIGNPVPVSPQPWNPTNPTPVAGATPGTTAPGGSSTPTEGVNPSDVPGEAGKNCLASGWSWNPVSWVMVPTQCALQWAFVPPKAKLDAAMAAIQPKLDARGIEPFVEPVMAGVAGLGGSGCMGPPIDLSSIHLPVMYPFEACTAPMSTIATGVNSFFALTLVVQGGMSCIRGAASAFGFNWGLGSKSEDGA